VSYNGGPGGIAARPTPGELVAEHERHFEATPMQAQHEHAAFGNHAQWASQNHGRPAFAATAHPGEFNRPAAAVSHAGPAANHAGPAANHPVAQNHPAAAPQAHNSGGGQSHGEAHPQAKAANHPAAPRGNEHEKK
jgi:hypothetical protein